MTTKAATRRGWTTAARWAAAALVVCLVLASKDLLAAAIRTEGDPWLSGVSSAHLAAWAFCFYLLWAALSPAIFASARLMPITRRRWVGPLAFHLVLSVAVSAIVPTAVCLLVFDPLVRGVSWTGQGLPWVSIGLGRAAADPLSYWMILGAAFWLRAYDESRERARAAADLRRALVAAEVEALKMKLQPHFLFNTLNSIGFLAVEKDIEGVVSMVERLGALMRAAMRVAGTQLVKVGQELALVDQYLAIEEIRFADRLRVVRRVAPGAAEALIPSLVLQPVIENSIKHGFSKRIDASRLELTIRREGDSLVAAVEDDGPGVPPGWNLATHCGRGLKNVVERLEKLYPGAWSFTLRDLPGGGSVARLRIPWQLPPAA